MIQTRSACRLFTIKVLSQEKRKIHLIQARLFVILTTDADYNLIIIIIIIIKAPLS